MTRPPRVYPGHRAATQSTNPRRRAPVKKHGVSLIDHTENK